MQADEERGSKFVHRTGGRRPRIPRPSSLTGGEFGVFQERMPWRDAARPPIRWAAAGSATSHEIRRLSDAAPGRGQQLVLLHPPVAIRDPAVQSREQGRDELQAAKRCKTCFRQCLRELEARREQPCGLDLGYVAKQLKLARSALTVVSQESLWLGWRCQPAAQFFA